MIFSRFVLRRYLNTRVELARLLIVVDLSYFHTVLILYEFVIGKMVIISRRRHSINDLVEDNLYLLFYDVRVVGLNVTSYIKKYIMHVFGLKLAILDF